MRAVEMKSQIIPHRKLSMGAEVVAGQGTSFRVWAPDRKRISLVVQGTRADPRTQGRGGWVFSVALHDVAAGARYRFRLDDEQEEYPDPASRYEPKALSGRPR